MLLHTNLQSLLKSLIYSGIQHRTDSDVPVEKDNKAEKVGRISSSVWTMDA